MLRKTGRGKGKKGRGRGDVATWRKGRRLGIWNLEFGTVLLECF